MNAIMQGILSFASDKIDSKSKSKITQFIKGNGKPNSLETESDKFDFERFFRRYFRKRNK